MGEIEHTLLKFPGLRSTIISVIDTQQGNKQLVAYVTGYFSQPSAEIEEEIRHFLVDHLIDYMVPAAIMVLDEIPLTPIGKVDYKALPSPQQLQQKKKPSIELIAPLMMLN